jgi:aryl-alcohol dehydrogenase-like predicted oxidoreductase
MAITRRELIKLGSSLSLAAVSGGLQPVNAGAKPVVTTTIPSSGLKVPSIGIGTRSYKTALDSPQMNVFRDTLQTFHGMGGTLIDTSPNYGNSEQVLGHLMRELAIRQDMFMATKVDQTGHEAGIDRMNQSFVNLGGDQIELMQVHNLRGTETQLKTMKAWKEEGRFRHIGITTHSVRQHDEVEQLMRKHPLDFIQVNYSLADRAAAERILPLAQDRGIAVLVNLPLGRGRLFEAVGDRGLPDWARDIDAQSWGQVFLKYIIGHPAATIPIPGTSKPHHAADNMGAAVGRLPDQNLRQAMERYFDQLI